MFDFRILEYRSSSSQTFIKLIQMYLIIFNIFNLNLKVEGLGCTFHVWTLERYLDQIYISIRI